MPIFRLDYRNLPKRRAVVSRWIMLYILRVSAFYQNRQRKRNFVHTREMKLRSRDLSYVLTALRAVASNPFLRWRRENQICVLCKRTLHINFLVKKSPYWVNFLFSVWKGQFHMVWDLSKNEIFRYVLFPFMFTPC
jgi:hypothetical protein